jgi:phytanoyl-CoA hydroxylase
MLTPEQRRQFDRDGVLVLPAFKPAHEVASLLARTNEILWAVDPATGGGIFSTREPGRAADDWFLDSGNAVRCFFEEEAFDAQGRLTRPLPQAINKIGHAVHDLDPVFDAFSRGPQLAELAADLGLQEPRIWQSMLICKQPGIGGEVRWHQDASYFFTEPITVTTFWFALEDADLDNGCLWVQPGGHRGPLRERFVRDGRATRLLTLDTTPWPDERDSVPVPCKAGTLVVFHGLLPHWSAANRSPRSRHAYTLHVTDGRSAYAPTNWIQRGAGFPVRGFV